MKHSTYSGQLCPWSLTLLHLQLLVLPNLKSETPEMLREGTWSWQRFLVLENILVNCLQSALCGKLDIQMESWTDQHSHSFWVFPIICVTQTEHLATAGCFKVAGHPQLTDIFFFSKRVTLLQAASVLGEKRGKGTSRLCKSASSSMTCWLTSKPSAARNGDCVSERCDWEQLLQLHGWGPGCVNWFSYWWRYWSKT